MNDFSPIPPPQEALPDRLTQLRAQGAQRFDPAGFAYLESLSQRLAAMPCGQGKLEQHLAEFEQRFGQAQAAASALVEECVGECIKGDQTGLSEDERQALRQALDLGDCRAVQRLVRRFRARRQPSPVAKLRDTLYAQSPAPGDIGVYSMAERVPAAFTAPGLLPQPPRRELRALSQLRAVQARLTTEKRIAHAIAHTPANAGPMNAHRLVARAVGSMQQISPDYLNRFVGYVDTLLALEQLAKKN
ncbi:DUF2894 domain-containing protein [Marinobacter sp. SS21]|uniref:DUF2894 domain-containing protein n=1 Tax=Marinobacter sp. SS21 TaxID=2979460 RepID=UPI00232EF169|nr:DUF2894 domain-containing protein [Marinobacter sp. SS21]MDC0664337.1 DUF2894 domain-containing protein [Marinobacter sp. SS21]